MGPEEESLVKDVQEEELSVEEEKQETKSSGQTKTMLMKNKRGKIVSKKAHAKGLRTYKKNGLAKWTKAFMQARKNLKIKGFVAYKKGSKFYKEAMRLYKK